VNNLHLATLTSCVLRLLMQLDMLENLRREYRQDRRQNLFWRKSDERRWLYRIGRLRLIIQAGGRCVDCGCDEPDRLQFDHIKVRTWVARSTSRWVRLARYRRELEAGEVVLRCSECNCKLGTSHHYQCTLTREDIPE